MDLDYFPNLIRTKEEVVKFKVRKHFTDQDLLKFEKYDFALVLDLHNDHWDNLGIDKIDGWFNHEQRTQVILTDYRYKRSEYNSDGNLYVYCWLPKLPFGYTRILDFKR